MKAVRKKARTMRATIMKPRPRTMKARTVVMVMTTTSLHTVGDNNEDMAGVAEVEAEVEVEVEVEEAAAAAGAAAGLSHKGLLALEPLDRW